MVTLRKTLKLYSILLVVNNLRCSSCSEFNGTNSRQEKRFYLEHFPSFNGKVNLPQYSECNAKTNTPGICLRPSECALVSGTPTGICSASFICCTASLQCGQASNAKVIVINQKIGTMPAPLACNYIIDRFSPSVCQIRVDFDTMLPQPEYVSTISPPYTYPDCSSSYMSIGKLKFCGENSDQHIYIEYGQAVISETISVYISPNQQARWNLTVTQLECFVKNSKEGSLPFRKNVPWVLPGIVRSSHSFAPIADDRTVAFMEIYKKEAHDINLIAPHGCLQYFYNDSGTFESFNFHEGNGPFIPNMNYAICFKRKSTSTSIRFRIERFQMSSNDDKSVSLPMTDGDCIDEQAETNIASNDYLLIPNSVILNNGFKATRFCGDILNEKEMISSPPGPFTVIINTGKMYLPPSLERIQPRAFKIHYSIF